MLATFLLLTQLHIAIQTVDYQGLWAIITVEKPPMFSFGICVLYTAKNAFEDGFAADI